MAQIALVNPQIIINNIAIPYVPNSLKFDLGLGEQNVKAVAGGAGTSSSVYFNDIETSFSKVTFEMFTTDLSIETHKDWKALENANVIEIIGEGGVTVTFPFMAHTNRVEFEVGNDKMVSLEFMGDPAIS